MAAGVDGVRVDKVDERVLANLACLRRRRDASLVERPGRGELGARSLRTEVEEEGLNVIGCDGIDS